MTGFDRLMSFGSAGPTSWTLRSGSRFEERRLDTWLADTTEFTASAVPYERVPTDASANDEASEQRPVAIGASTPPATDTMPHESPRTNFTGAERPVTPTAPPRSSDRPAAVAAGQRLAAARDTQSATRAPTHRDTSVTEEAPAGPRRSQAEPPVVRPSVVQPAVVRPRTEVGSAEPPLRTVDPALVSAAVLRELRRRGITGIDAHVVPDATVPGAAQGNTAAVSLHTGDGTPPVVPPAATSDTNVTVRIDRVQVVSPTPPPRAPRPVANPGPSPLTEFLRERARSRR